MEFNKSHIKQITVILTFIVITGSVLVGKFTHKNADNQTAGAQDNDPDRGRNSEMPDAVTGSKPAVLDENDETLKKIAEQMEKDREQERRIKDLRMQREETDLELDEQKALSALNKLKKEGIGSFNEVGPTRDYNMDIKIVYLGGTDAQKEAILSINGVNYSVKTKDRPVQKIEVQSITNNDVTVRFLSPENTTATYQFKWE